MFSEKYFFINCQTNDMKLIVVRGIELGTFGLLGEIRKSLSTELVGLEKGLHHKKHWCDNGSRVKGCGRSKHFRTLSIHNKLREIIKQNFFYLR